MKGNEIASKLPAKAGKAREAAILEYIKKGQFFMRWVPLSISLGGTRATFYVTAEPLMLGESWEDGFYPGVTGETMQKIADHLNATLLTPKLVDDIWRAAAIRIDPIVGMASTPAEVQVMADTATFLRHTARIKDRIRADRAAAGSGPVLIANIGKYWTVGSNTSLKKTNKSGTVAPQNYGFLYTKKGTRNRTVTRIPDVDLFQTPGLAHDMAHSDYSQVVMLVSRTVHLCSAESVSGLGDIPKCKSGSSCSAPGGPGSMSCVDIYDLANDPQLAALVSHEGTVNMRYPTVAYEPSPSGAKTPPSPGPIGRGAGGVSVVDPGAGKAAGGSQSTRPQGGIPRRTRPGEKGPDVMAWQAFLIAQGYDLSPFGADGDHGKKTEEASLDWEKKNPQGASSILAASMAGSPGMTVGIALIAAGAGIGYLGYSALVKG